MSNRILPLYLLLTVLFLFCTPANSRSAELAMPDLEGAMEETRRVNDTLRIKVEGDWYVVVEATQLSLCGQQIELEAVESYEGAKVNINIQDFESKNLSKLYILCE